MKKNLPPIELLIGQTVPNGGDYRLVAHVGSGFNARVFRAESTALARSVACKIIPRNNLIGDDTNPDAWRHEFEAANRLNSGRVVKFFDVGDWEIEGYPSVFLLADYVDGISLEKYPHVNMEFIVLFLGEMLDFLNELELQKLRHGDLHSRNVLVADNSRSLTGPPVVFKVTDFGVGLATRTALQDDYHQLAEMIRNLLEKVTYSNCEAEDKFTYNWLNDELIGKGLLEHDSTYSPAARNPPELYRQLRDVHTRFVSTAAGASRRTLVTPFDFLSCEQFGQSHILLKDLYSDKLLGLNAIEAVNNLVLTGPRGCGKTTVFSSLSLTHRYHTRDDDPRTTKYLGIYYRADDLYFCFPRYERPSSPTAVDLPVHFLTATLAGRLLEAASLWLERHFPKLWRLHETTAAAAIWSYLQLSEQPVAGPSFDSIRRAMGKERERAKRCHQKKQELPEAAFGPETLPAVCAILAEHFLPVGERFIYFFIDDYSAPKISVPLQENLNRLVMQRSPNCFFKLATESPASYASGDIDGKSYVEGREFQLVNLGIDFINAKHSEKLKFVEDIFVRRFSYTANYPVRNLAELLGGKSLPSQNDVARQIREGTTVEVHGTEALAEMCSGDIHFLIELVSQMVAAAGGPEALSREEGEARISPSIQHKAIRAYAGNFLRHLRLLEDGGAIVDVVEAFGAVASSFLKYKNSKNEKAVTPHQASRIEPYERPQLTGRTKEIYNNLLRYSVFIEDARGKSRRGDVVPRLYLRRFLIPQFQLTFSKRDSIGLSVSDFDLLLTDPKSFKNKLRLRASDDGSDDSALQLTLGIGPNSEEATHGSPEERPGTSGPSKTGVS